MKSLKHHSALQPLFIIIGAGMVFVGAYIFRWVDVMISHYFEAVIWIRSDLVHTYSDSIFFVTNSDLDFNGVARIIFF
jgi:hypothetical protein